MNNDIVFELAERNGWMSDIDRLVNIYWGFGQALHFGVPGDIVEVGCHAGGTSIFLQMLIDHFAPERELHLYDTFQGMPEPGPQDAYLVKGDRPSTIDQVRENFDAYGLRQPHIHVGWFEDTLPDQLPPRIAAGYFDGDFYDSIMVSLESVWPRLSPNGLLIIDDYADLDLAPNAFAKLPGVKLACDDFFADRDTKPFVLVGGNTLAFAGVRKPEPAYEASDEASALYVLRMIHEGGEIDDELGQAHRAWVESHYESGRFFASGPADGGGVALATGGGHAALEALLESDPVVVAGRGRYEVTACDVSLSAPGFNELLERRRAPTRRLDSESPSDDS